MSSTSIETSTTSLLIRLREPAVLPTALYFSDVFSNLGSLLFVGSVIGNIEDGETGVGRSGLEGLGLTISTDDFVAYKVGDDWPRWPSTGSGAFMVSPNVLSASQLVAESFEVVRVRYESPIEILMQSTNAIGPISVYGGAAFVAVKGVLYLWKEALDIRQKHALTKQIVSDAALAVELNDELRQKLPLFVGSNMERVTIHEDEVAYRALVAKSLPERIMEASKLLASTDEVAIVDP